MSETAASKNEKKVQAVLQQYRRDSGMTKAEWNNFCKRYADRDVGTILHCLVDEYGKLPHNAKSLLQKAIQNEAKKSAVYNAYCK